MKNYIAIDLGATSGRVILSKVDEGKVDMETVYRFPTPLVNLDGKYYWNIYSIYSDIVNGLSMIGKRGVKVESIGVDTWGIDVVSVAKDGSFNCLPRSYRDPYTEGIPEKFFENCMSSEQLYERTGVQIMNINTVFQLYVQKKSKSSALKHARKILFMPDAVSYMLTGKKVCEYTILSTSALMNPRTKSFDRKILHKCGLCRFRFPKIVYPGSTIGKLTENLANITGLGRVPVKAVAGHDTASAVAAVPAANENFAYLSSGTWSLMGIEIPSPKIDQQMRELNFTNEGGAKGNTRLLKNITGMWLLEQCLAKWRSEGKEYSYEFINRMAAGLDKSPDLIDPDDPAFASPADMPAAICANLASRGLPAPKDDAAMVRLIYDSLAAKYAETLGRLRVLAPFPIEALHIIGGGSQNELLNQMTADACRVKVIAGPSEGTALGNVMIQAGLSRQDIIASVQTKEYKPNNTI